jgi:hypothetical protein
MQLRMTLAELGMSSVPSLMPIPSIQNVLSEDGMPAHDWVAKSLARFLNEFEWYARALKAERNKGVPR